MPETIASQNLLSLGRDHILEPLKQGTDPRSFLKRQAKPTLISLTYQGPLLDRKATESCQVPENTLPLLRRQRLEFINLFFYFGQYLDMKPIYFKKVTLKRKYSHQVNGDFRRRCACEGKRLCAALW